MAVIEIVEVTTRKQLKQFVLFPMDLYADCANYVPPLISDEMATFARDHNPVFQTADAKLFLALREGRIVGRIAGIVSQTANEKFGAKNVRFGWFDAIDDDAVATALFDAVEQWGRSLGMETITGPQGFNQFGKAGMLIEGFEHLPTMATYYNYPYYHGLLTRYGFVKDVDYVEFRIRNMTRREIPPRLAAVTEKIKNRGRYRVLDFRSKKDMMARADEIFDCLQDTYVELYGVTPLTPVQRKYGSSQEFVHEFGFRQVAEAMVQSRDVV